MTGDAERVEAVTRRVRACFNRLKALGDDLHKDLGVTAAMRAVLEALHEGGDQTMPEIARAKRVTRQHIQALTARLTAAGLARLRDNPADKRSPFVVLTPAGRKTIQRMRKRETTVLAELAAALAGCDLEATLATLAALEARLDETLAPREPDQKRPES